MLYILHMGNHPDLTYKGGQGPIVHLVSDLRATVAWANSEKRPWAFCDGNAAAHYTSFYDDLADLDNVDWAAVANHTFTDPIVKERKQSEFLLFEYLPWHLIERIGVKDDQIAAKVRDAMNGMEALPAVSVEPSWYF